MNGYKVLGISFVALLLAACGGGGGGSSSGGSGGGVVIVDTPLGDTSIDLTQDDLDEIDDSSGTVGTLLDCSDNADGGLKGCWKNTECTPTTGPDSETYYLSSRAEFKVDGSQEVADFAGYFYDNDTCTAQALIVKRPEGVIVTYSEGGVSTDSNGQNVTALTLSIKTNGVRNFQNEGVYLITMSDELCLSDNIAMTEDGLAIANRDETNVDLATPNCYERTGNL